MNKANIYAAITAVVTIYSLLVGYIVFYFKEDFKQVFCKKRTEVSGINIAASKIKTG